MKKITDTVAGLAQPVLAELGCELWDVEYVREGGEWYLRVYIDRESGVDIELCEKVSHALDPVLDEADPIPGSYIFEVSSAGAERALRRPSDFEKFIGSKVLLKLYRPADGRKEHTGTLIGYNDDGVITVQTSGGQMSFSKSDVALCRLMIEI